jgi:hypothetical protein
MGDGGMGRAIWLGDLFHRMPGRIRVWGDVFPDYQLQSMCVYIAYSDSRKGAGI